MLPSVLLTLYPPRAGTAVSNLLDLVDAGELLMADEVLADDHGGSWKETMTLA